LHKAGNPDELRSALLWLCLQGAPNVIVPSPEEIDIKSMDGFYVPQNPSVAEGPKHPRKPRSFPTVHLDTERATVFFHWPDAAPDESLLRGIETLATGLPRFGHSSSLVVATASNDRPPCEDGWCSLAPTPESEMQSAFRLRVPYPGLLESAESAFAGEDRANERDDLISKAERSARPDRPLKPAASPRGRHDPRHRWQGYVEPVPPETPKSVWDHRVLLLARVEGTRPGLSSTWQILETFHRTLLDQWSRDAERGPVPSWISGHLAGADSTAPARENHLAFFPVADVHHHHAQGRLMGIGLAFPRPESTEFDSVRLRLDWQKVMAALFPCGESLELVCASGGIRLVLQPAAPDESRVAFQLPRWVGPSATWASVTPMIFDRHPKPHFRKDPHLWAESARRIAAEACQRIGLPDPQTIEVSPYSPIEGVPPSNAFAPPPVRPGRPARAHFHVTLQFGQKILGPVLLGAGRFRGYGLFAPLD
jgi:CRISPR-associated protein Csb2